MGLENLMTTRQGNLANTGLNANANLAGHSSDLGQQIAQLMGTGGQIGMEGTIGAAEALASGILGLNQMQMQQNMASDANNASIWGAAFDMFGDAFF